MTEPKRIEAAQNWIRLAAEDLESAEHMPHNLNRGLGVAMRPLET